MNVLPNQDQENLREQRIDALLNDLSITEDSAEAAAKAKELYGLMVGGEEGSPPPRLDQVGRLVKENSRLVEKEIVASKQTLLIGTFLCFSLCFWAMYSFARLPATAPASSFWVDVGFCCTSYGLLLYISYKWGAYMYSLREYDRSKETFSSVIDHPEVKK